MSSTEKPTTDGNTWDQLEQLADELHDLARTPIDAAEFYRVLLQGAVAMLATDGGAVWQRDAHGLWSIVYQANLARVLDTQNPDTAATHQQLLTRTSQSREVQLLSPGSGTADTLENPTDAQVLIGTVPVESGPERLIELFLPTGCGPEIHQGWRELLETLRQIAADYHAWDEFRHLRKEQGFHTSSLAMLRRVHGNSDLQRTAFEVANEGRQLVGADRLSVLLRRGNRWRLLAVSGVDRVEPRSDAAKSLCQLADWTARWNEPLEYAEQSGLESLPDELADVLARHADQSQARSVVAVPLEFVRETEIRKPTTVRPSAVLIAEQFQGDNTTLTRQHVQDLGELCVPALQQADRLDRFPLRTILRWSDRWAKLGWLRGIARTLLYATAAAALVGALVFVERDFEVEASANLVPLVDHDVFASTDGTVATVLVDHGDSVNAGDVLATLDDPQLVLDLQRVRGEIETTRKRLEAIAVARTDRQVRENIESESLSLSAEAEQLRQRMNSLERQTEILLARQSALTVKSPIDGIVLTLDVQHLLETRPVSRGQVLFTVADPNVGWQLLAEVPQDRIGHVTQAQDEQESVPVRVRLVGDIDQIFSGHLNAIRETAVLDVDSLAEDLPAVQVEISLDDQLPSIARPGMNADVRIYCGRKSLGYVWLHDVWETVHRWIIF